jgi:hypothetical protein
MAVGTVDMVSCSSSSCIDRPYSKGGNPTRKAVYAGSDRLHLRRGEQQIGAGRERAVSVIHLFRKVPKPQFNLAFQTERP